MLLSASMCTWVLLVSVYCVLLHANNSTAQVIASGDNTKDECQRASCTLLRRTDSCERSSYSSDSYYSAVAHL
jgi:hypothetical protein